MKPIEHKTNTTITEEEMGFKNGRSNYKELKEKYEKVIIRHNLSEDGTARTTCFLVTGDRIFVGVSKFSNRTFNFSKKKGRVTAQGRAEHSHDVFLGKTTEREDHKKRREELSYVLTPKSGSTTDELLDNLLNNSES